uniref:Uncharacterized protein n=1 Tax=Ciona intestinalis TaxID=7719 RepID=H2XJT7_CIOIN
ILNSCSGKSIYTNVVVFYPNEGDLNEILKRWYENKLPEKLYQVLQFLSFKKFCIILKRKW